MPPRTEAEIRASLDAVIEDVETNQRIYGWFAGNVGELARGVKALSGCVEQRFAQVEQRFEQVDQRFDQVDRRLDSFEANTKTQFGLVTDSINRLDARIERLVGYIERDELKEHKPAAEAATV